MITHWKFGCRASALTRDDVTPRALDSTPVRQATADLWMDAAAPPWSWPSVSIMNAITDLLVDGLHSAGCHRRTGRRVRPGR
jgi:hypothetical protein